MRLRLVLPRQGRRGSLSALALPAAALVAGCGSVAPRLQPPAPAPPQRLAIGLTEANAHLVAPGPRPPAFAAWRDRLVALRPAYVRVFVDWAKTDGRLDAPESGCMREILPCAGYAGIRDQLRALAARRLRDPGRWVPLLTIYGVPERYAVSARGCERTDASPRARAITADGVRAYERLLGEVVALARAEGAGEPFVSPWNEPNHPSLISPQRGRCDPRARARAPRVYAQLARAAARVTADERLVLGELAGYTEPTPRTTAIGEFVAALPDDVACGAAAWSVHDYAQASGPSTDAVGALARALRRRACTARTPIWITETGAGRRLRGTAREADEVTACRAMAERLARWDADPRVDAVFQYTFREDPAYPVGLADPQLTRLYPTYELWRAWSAAPPGDAAPRDACR